MARLESRLDAMEKQFGELRERMAHLEGLLEGLREAISGTGGGQLGGRCPASKQVGELPD